MYITKGGDSNLGLKNRKSRLLESVHYIKTQSGGLVTNVYPKWRLGDKCICNEESLHILGNLFNHGGNNASHVTNTLTKCRQSFYVYLVPVCYTQEPLLMFKRICINVYVNQR